MSTADRSQIQELMNQAGSLEAGPTQIGLLEEAVRLADMLVDIPLGFDARMKLTESAIFGGWPEKSIVAFSWCLAQHDRDPERFDEWTLLWHYKWIIDYLPSFPQVSRSQISGALTDFASRLEKSGQGMRPLHKLRFLVARNVGDMEEYHQAFASWQKAPRVNLSDCPACDLDAEVTYLANNGREEEALAKAAPILAGTSKCRSVPHHTLAKLLLPLLRIGRAAEAMPLHHKGYRLIANNRAFLFRLTDHLEFLTLTENFDKAVRVFTTGARWSLETAKIDGRFHFSNAARFLFERIQASGKKTIRLSLPECFPALETSGRYSIPDLIGWFEADAIEIGKKFDARNGNDMFARKIEASRELGALVRPTPLRAPGKTSTD